MGNENVDMRMGIKLIWETWDIRIFMLVSLLIQTLLTFLAPFRKRSASSILSFSLWLLYLCADAVALFTIGLISSNSSQGGTQLGDHKKVDLLAFWAPFLLLHLGGPDTITALALADNELWHRHALQLITQLVITLYVFIQSVRRNVGFFMIWVPTLVMFIDGCTKYVERTCALYFASADSFRDSLRPKPEAGPNYARLVEEYSSATSAHIPIKIQGKDGPSDAAYSEIHGLKSNVMNNDDSSFEGANDALTDDTSMVAENEDPRKHRYEEDEKVKTVKIAYHFYNKFKGLLADAILSLKDRTESREFFLQLPALDFAKIIETELSFMYDVFFTKVFLLQSKLHYARVICIISIITSLLLFTFQDKSNYYGVDVSITFALLGGAIALDICAVVMFLLSDWWIITVFNSNDMRSFRRPKILQDFMVMLFRCTKCVRTPNWRPPHQALSSYTLLERCFKDPPSIYKYIGIKRIKDIFIGWLYAHGKLIEYEPLIKFIIQELQSKAKAATTTEITKEVCSARGNLVLQDDYFLISECLHPWTLGVDYDESLLTWHLATDICYYTSEQESNNATKKEDDINSFHREFSKKLSDYMLYLLLRQESLMSPVVGISDIRFEDTCEEARKFFKHKKLSSWSEDMYDKVKKMMCKFCRKDIKKNDKDLEEEFLKKFCENVLKVKSVIRPIVAKGDKSKSVLFDACRLAKQLKMFKEKQWEITSKVWVELLCYAAIRCSPRSHLARLNQGGELITVVWLTMAHVGLVEQFRQNQGFGWTKLVMDD